MLWLRPACLCFILITSDPGSWASAWVFVLGLNSEPWQPIRTSFCQWPLLDTIMKTVQTAGYQLSSYWPAQRAGPQNISEGVLSMSVWSDKLSDGLHAPRQYAINTASLNFVGNKKEWRKNTGKVKSTHALVISGTIKNMWFDSERELLRLFY